MCSISFIVARWNGLCMEFSKELGRTKFRDKWVSCKYYWYMCCAFASRRPTCKSMVLLYIFRWCRSWRCGSVRRRSSLWRSSSTLVCCITPPATKNVDTWRPKRLRYEGHILEAQEATLFGLTKLHFYGQRGQIMTLILLELKVRFAS